MAFKAVVGSLVLGGLFSTANATCCWSKWGDASTCGKYPSGGAGGLCNEDFTT
eukprot:CAMPEP_0169367934 /NCGR_PEP_ID=MMETSP1017-20121227/33952_1 /TAXON_ID=342587 /ORGANISM="Karlodinium micrum, Strain CCMP2283" /LENGTH=52 /DNA_ID=CAMNT_0009466045 /DNA_START=47 /DNA_END=202 /DNA_ORIENTATION=+